MVAKKKILIVEDEAAMRRILKDTLRQEGYDVAESSDGEQGLVMAKEYQPDLILLDIVMPKMDGMIVLKKLQANDWGKNIPVLILTNLSNVPSVINALEFDDNEEKAAFKDDSVSMEKARENIKSYLDTRLENGVYDFLIKTDCKLEDIVNKVKSFRLENLRN